MRRAPPQLGRFSLTDHSDFRIFNSPQSKFMSLGRLPEEGLMVSWSIAVEAGDVNEPWPNAR